MSVIIDLLVVIIIGLFLWIGYRKGFVRSIVSLVGMIVAAMAAMFLSTLIATLIFNSFIGPGLNVQIKKLIPTHVTQSLQTAKNAVNKNEQDAHQKINEAKEKYKESIDGFLKTLPSGISSEIEKAIGSSETTGKLADAFSSNVDNSVDSIINSLTETILKPLIINGISLVVFIILFFVLTILVNLIGRSLKVVDRIPIVGNINKVLGGVLGAVKATLLLYVIAVILKFVLKFAHGGFFNEQVIDDTLLFQVFYYFNPFG